MSKYSNMIVCLGSTTLIKAILSIQGLHKYRNSFEVLQTGSEHCGSKTAPRT